MSSVTLVRQDSGGCDEVIQIFLFWIVCTLKKMENSPFLLQDYAPASTTKVLREMGSPRAPVYVDAAVVSRAGQVSGRNA